MYTPFLGRRDPVRHGDVGNSALAGSSLVTVSRTFFFFLFVLFSPETSAANCREDTVLLYIRCVYCYVHDVIFYYIFFFLVITF